MQLINQSEQPCIPVNSSVPEQWVRPLALEIAQDEIELLREQISSLQQELSEQLWHRQAAEQELHRANQELKLMETEIQQVAQVKRLFLEEIKEFIKTLPAEGISKNAFVRLLRKFHKEIGSSEEVHDAVSASSSKEKVKFDKHYAALSNRLTHHK